MKEETKGEKKYVITCVLQHFTKHSYVKILWILSTILKGTSHVARILGDKDIADFSSHAVARWLGDCLEENLRQFQFWKWLKKLIIQRKKRIAKKGIKKMYKYHDTCVEVSSEEGNFENRML